MSERLCIFCKHWAFDGGEPGYSEMTPGMDASMNCLKGRWRTTSSRGFRLYELDSPEDFRAKIKQAEKCPDYSPCADNGEARGE